MSAVAMEAHGSFPPPMQGPQPPSMPMPTTPAQSSSSSSNKNSCCSLEELESIIRINGQRREEGLRHRNPSDTFSADLVLREESGFEIWLGSLDDALALSQLNGRHINGVLNCAVEESELECAIFRTQRPVGRKRCHARGESGCNPVGEAIDAVATLDRDQIRAMALFDREWYSTILDYDVAYCGIAADDVDGYDLSTHFDEMCSFLHECRREKRKVLVHCIMGINRSSAAVVAFLCQKMGMTLKEAASLASDKRGYILSNGSFRTQLINRYGGGCAAPASKS